MSRFLPCLLGLVTLCLLIFSPPCLAQDSGAAPTPPIDVIPAETAFKKGLIVHTDDITHPALKMTPDKSELVRLDKPAGSIIIGNPNHLSIMADSAQTLVLIPRAAGATYFTVLDKAGSVIMQRHVIVASPEKKYMRVRRSCASGQAKDCQETSVFYCPDMCHKIIIGNAEASDSAQSGGIAPASVEENTNAMNDATGAEGSDPAASDVSTE